MDEPLGFEPTEWLMEGSSQLSRCFKDPGVRRELRSWRWKLIKVLCFSYASAFAAQLAVNRIQLQSDGYEIEGHVYYVSSSEHTRSREPEEFEKLVTHSNMSNEEIEQTYSTSDERACMQENAKTAVSELLAFRKEKVDAKLPIVLGGIGDSGTRAVAFLVTQLGVWMGKFGVTVKKDSRDSKLFIHGFPTVTCDTTNTSSSKAIKSYIFYSKSMQECGSADYNRTCVSPAVWNVGVQWTSKLFRTLLSDTISYTSRRSNREKHPFGLWGFKHPRASFVLPYILHVTEGFKYIHIVRDGRDISAGDNTLFFNTCHKYYRSKMACEDTYEMRLELWSRLNLDVLDWANRNLGKDRFLVVRIEDLVKGHRSCFERIAAFVQTSQERGVKVIDQSIRLFTVKQDRYFGQKYTEEERGIYSQVVRQNYWASKAFKALGYDVENWNTLGNCAALSFPFDQNEL